MFWVTRPAPRDRGYFIPYCLKVFVAKWLSGYAHDYWCRKGRGFESRRKHLIFLAILNQIWDFKGIAGGVRTKSCSSVEGFFQESWKSITPCGLYQDSKWSIPGVYLESSRILEQHTIAPLKRGPGGLQVDSRWTPDGLQVDSRYSIRSLPGLLMESIRIRGSV